MRWQPKRHGTAGLPNPKGQHRLQISKILKRVCMRVQKMRCSHLGRSLHLGPLEDLDTVALLRLVEHDSWAGCGNPGSGEVASCGGPKVAAISARRRAAACIHLQQQVLALLRHP